MLPIAAVGLSMEAHQISLLELNGQQDVAGRGNGEYQMGCRHRGCRPENHQPTQIQRMSHVAVQARGSEANRNIWSAKQIKIDLAEAEQIEVIDDERAREYCQPTQGI